MIKGLLTRRGALGLIGSAPIAGPAAFKAVAEDLASGRPHEEALSGVGASPEATNAVMGFNDVELSPRQMLLRQSLAREINYRQFRGVPPEIESKRSWSPAFKDHCYREYRMELDRVEQEVLYNNRVMRTIARFLGVT